MSTARPAPCWARGRPELLAAHADLTPEADKTGWHRVFWMYGTTRDLADKDGSPRSAAAVFATDPEAVIAFARKSAVMDVNNAW